MSELSETLAAHLQHCANLDRAKADVTLRGAQVSEALVDYARSDGSPELLSVARRALQRLRMARQNLAEEQSQSDARSFENTVAEIRNLHAKDAE